MSTDSLDHKRFIAARRVHRSRAIIHGTSRRPRLSVHISNKNIAAQLINDDDGKTIAQVSSMKHKAGETMSQQAAWVGEEIARQAGKHKVKQVVFDRGRRRYHGRLKALAESARAKGLEF